MGRRASRTHQPLSSNPSSSDGQEDRSSEPEHRGYGDLLDSSETQGQTTLFTETARLSEGFYDQLTRHFVPLEEAAIWAINNNSVALDVYAWLA